LPLPLPFLSKVHRLVCGLAGGDAAPQSPVAGTGAGTGTGVGGLVAHGARTNAHVQSACTQGALPSPSLCMHASVTPKPHDDAVRLWLEFADTKAAKAALWR
jgi:hypothetical protein